MKLVKAGYLKKTHGYRGQVEIVFTDCSFSPFDFKGWIFVTLNGYFIPFFIESVSGSLNHLIAIIRYIDSEKKAKRFTGKDFFLPYDEDSSIIAQPNNIVVLSHPLEQFTVLDTSRQIIGQIVAVIDKTDNPLLQIINSQDKEILIPFNSHYIKKIDKQKGQLIVDLPNGFIELYT